MLAGNCTYSYKQFKLENVRLWLGTLHY
uniref:Uncharacterized protein n=1 Tax=Anguilla anguilla TaxID=7936 RepID=A0A0E9P9S8_ANGAN